MNHKIANNEVSLMCTKERKKRSKLARYVDNPSDGCVHNFRKCFGIWLILIETEYKQIIVKLYFTIYSSMYLAWGKQLNGL